MVQSGQGIHGGIETIAWSQIGGALLKPDNSLERIQKYYKANPRMVSSPFGGVDGLDRDLFLSVLSRLGLSLTGRRILDVGCGRGFLESVITSQGGCYTGLDVVLSRAAFSFVMGDAHCLPFKDDAFDLITCVDAFEHFPQPDSVVQEFRRVLRPGGSIFLSVPNYSNIAGLVKWWYEKSGAAPQYGWAPFGGWQYQEYEYPMTPAKLRRLFQMGDFTIGKRLAYAREISIGLFPWVEHPKMPERLRWGIRSAFDVVSPLLSRIFPWASLHLFWRFDLLNKADHC